MTHLFYHHLASLLYMRTRTAVFLWKTVPLILLVFCLLPKQGYSQCTATITGNPSFIAGSSTTLQTASLPNAQYCWQNQETPWQNVGIPGFSAGSAESQSLVINGGTPYVSFSDGANGNRTTVMKFNGASWELVGSAGFSPGPVGRTSLAFDGSTPYLAFTDLSNNGKTVVMKFNGTSWALVGGAGFGPSQGGLSSYRSLAINNGTPYVAFQGEYVDGSNGSKASVVKFDGTNWVAVGTTSGFSNGLATDINLVFNDNVPYVAFTEFVSGYRARVMKFDGANWVNVGVPGFSAGFTLSLSFAFSGSTPYVAYYDGANAGKTTVMKFDGSSWGNVGNPGFSAGPASFQSLAFEGSTPYVAYQDQANDRKTTVMKFDGANWVNAGNAAFSAGEARRQSLAFDGSTPYVAYRDAANGNKTTVMKLDIPCESTSNSLTVSSAGTYTVTVTDQNGCVATSAPVVVSEQLPTVNITAIPITVTEEGETFTFTATLSELAGVEVKIPLVYSGDAVLSSDYEFVDQPTSEFVIFPGQLSASVDLKSIPNNLVDGDRDFVVSLGTLTNGTPGTSRQATVTITDDDTAELSIAATTDAAEDDTDGFFMITTDKQFTSPVTVTIGIGGDAIAGADYTAIGTSVIFPANQSSFMIPVSVIGDDLVEDDETVIVTMTGTDNAAVIIGATGDATVTISDDDTAELSSAATTDAAEDATDGLFTITTDKQFTSPVTLTINVAGTATQGTDYSTIGTTVVFPANQSSVTIPVSVIGDDLVEGDEEVIVTMTGTDNSAVTIGPNDDATVTISDDDTAELSSAATTDAAEDATDGLFTITTDKQFTSPVTVTINVAGTATEGADYSTIGTTVVFPANQSSFTVPVSVIGDDLIEGDETVFVTMTETDNAAVTIGPNNDATVTITDDDTAELSIAATTNAAEDDVDGLFTITTTKQFTSPIIVTINVGGDAIAGADYTAFGTSVIFPANQSSFMVPVSVIGDDLIEGDETVIVTMTGTDNAAVTIGFLDQATVTIEDNDLVILIDASASGTPVPVGQDALLSATVTSDQPDNPPVAGVAVTFSLEGIGIVGTGVTNAEGVATLPVSDEVLGSLPIVYKVLAEAGTGEGRVESVAYLPIYDPNGNFVTGGGWIMSPAGAYKTDENLEGKANFGFVSKYKKGSNQVDGKTEFQFKAGDLYFKSTLHESGTLVISGKKATYRGEGNINGQPGYKFSLVALDGDWNGGTDPDQFRIKIWGDSGIIYDNGLGADENSDDATVLGGGSIVIHEAKGQGNKRVVTDLITVPWNTPIEVIEKKIISMSAEWFEGKDVKLNINTDSYNSLQPGSYQLRTELMENEWFELEEPITVNVLVADKPLATDIRLSNTILLRNIHNGSVIGDLRTIDPVDDQHTYSMSEQSDFELVGQSLIWKGAEIPANARITVFSLDRAGQRIERVIELSREPRFGDFIMFPNPASSEVNLEVELDQSMNVGVRIYDAIGRLVYQEEGVQNGIATYQIAIDHLSPGLYTVQMKTGKLVMNKRLIKK